jgi:hypothetical protein
MGIRWREPFIRSRYSLLDKAAKNGSPSNGGRGDFTRFPVVRLAGNRAIGVDDPDGAVVLFCSGVAGNFRRILLVYFV